MYLHKEGKIAEYQIGSIDEDVLWRVDNSSGFNIQIDQFENGLYVTREEALQAAMDYHETEGCALYLELYPAPEKGEWAFIAQDPDGDWCGYDLKPLLRKDQWEASAAKANGWDRISQSPPNPFWRKTLR